MNGNNLNQGGQLPPQQGSRLANMQNQHVNYNQQSQSGARMGRTEEINRNFSLPGQSLQRDAMGNTINVPPNLNNPAMQGQQMQMQGQQMQNQQMNQQQMAQQQQLMMQQMMMQQQMMQMQQQMQSQQQQQQTAQDNTSNKKGGALKFVALIAVVAIIAVVALSKAGVIGNKKDTPAVAEIDYNGSGKETLDNFVGLLHQDTFDATAIDNLVGDEEGDSYIAQEWAYVNNVKLREEFIQKACATVQFLYPTTTQMNVDGSMVLDNDGNPIEVESPMNDGEPFNAVVPDYDAIIALMDADNDETGRGYIKALFKASGYTKNDYTWNDEMADLLMQYVCDLGELPTTTVKINMAVDSGTIDSDADLDDALFGSESFHNMCAKFSQICVGWTGKKTEKYKEKEEQHNPEYEEWLDIFLKYFKADGGTYNAKTGEFKGASNFHKGISKWEPWYLRDDDDNYVLDKNGDRIVNYYSVKKEDGTDWIQPSETILVEVEKTRDIEDPWVEETAIMYNFIGTHWIQTSYKGIGSVAFRVGNGKKETPAGIGTPVITKIKCTDGSYHDVKVAVLGYWVGQDAIDYAEKFSAKNRGFTTQSVFTLITYEVEVENLENGTIEFNGTEMSLCDDNFNISSRTGTMYGFSEVTTLGAHEKVIVNDWAASTELPQKYVIWGKSFGRDYDMIYFNILAGTGNIPTYSAYKAFTGQSSIDESVNVEITDVDGSKAESDSLEQGSSDLDVPSTE